MEETPEHIWQPIIDHDFSSMHKMLDDLKDSLRGATGLESVNFYKPLQSIIFDAAMQAAEWKNKMRDIGDDILKSI